MKKYPLKLKNGSVHNYNKNQNPDSVLFVCFFAILWSLMYNELVFYLEKECFVLSIFRFCVFDEFTNFKICDVIINIIEVSKLNKLNF